MRVCLFRHFRIFLSIPSERIIVYYISIRLSSVIFKKLRKFRKNFFSSAESLLYTDSIAQRTVSKAMILAILFALFDFFLRIIVASMPM